MDRLQDFKRYSKRVINRFVKSEDAKDDADWNFNTHITDEMRVVTWKIENLGRSTLKLGEYYESPSFSTGFTCEVKWALRVYPAGRKIKDNVGISLCNISENSKISVKCELQAKLISESSKDDMTFSYKKPFVTFCSDDETALRKFFELDQSSNFEFGTDEFFLSGLLQKAKYIDVSCYLTVIHPDGDDENCNAGNFSFYFIYSRLDSKLT